MPLGIEQNNIAPQLIQNSGQALVQGIRQIGQQISGHLTELQTKRDLGAMAQEMQGLNVQSNEFPIQLTQMLTRHPLAAKDERGQMALSVLGKAHGQWQATEAEARAFQRQMQMQESRNAFTSSEFDRQEAARNKRPVSVAGVGLVDPSDIDEVTGQARVLAPAAPRGSTAMPFQATPQGAFDRRTGTYGPPPPAAAAKPMTEYQRAQLRRAERKDKISAINQEINQFDSNIASAERAYEAAFKREMEAKDADKLRHQADKTEVGKVADALKAEKKKKIELLQKLRDDDSMDAAVVDDAAAAVNGEVLPAVPPATELPVIQTAADAAKLPPGTQFRDKNGNVRTVPQR